MALLDKFGVSAEAESLYGLLLDGAQPEVGLLADRAGLDPELVRVCLAELREHDLLVDASTGRNSLAVVPPHIGIDRLIGRAEEALERRRAELLNSRDDASTLLRHYVQARVHHVGTLIDSMDDWIVARAHLFQLTQTARHSFVGTHLPVTLSPEATEDCRGMARRLAGQGIVGRLIVSRESLGPEHWMRYLDEAIGLGHRVRTMDAVPVLLSVVDDEVGVIPFSDAAGNVGAHFLRDPDLAAPLLVLFDELWGMATPLEGSSKTFHGHDERISEHRMRQVAGLMAAGLKDETIARRLGVSPRTVRRTVAAMMAQLGADTRFQAAHLAVQEGWLAAQPAPEPVDQK